LAALSDIKQAPAAIFLAATVRVALPAALHAASVDPLISFTCE
jgi:hypothetical protein